MPAVRALLRSTAITLAAALAVGCPPREAPTPPPDPAAPEGAALGPLPDPEHAPVNRGAGEELTLMIPRPDGSAVDLRELRGKWVVLELTTTRAADYRERYQIYRRLLARSGGALAVFLVALDAERDALSPEPETRPPGFELGWDPQGALAAQLQAAGLPTLLLLDTEGRIAAVAAGEGAARTIDDALSSALAAP